MVLHRVCLSQSVLNSVGNAAGWLKFREKIDAALLADVTRINLILVSLPDSTTTRRRPSVQEDLNL
jgi:hypothetical protein